MDGKLLGTLTKCLSLPFVWMDSILFSISTSQQNFLWESVLLAEKIMIPSKWSSLKYLNHIISWTLVILWMSCWWTRYRFIIQSIIMAMEVNPCCFPGEEYLLNSQLVIIKPLEVQVMHKMVQDMHILYAHTSIYLTSSLDCLQYLMEGICCKNHGYPVLKGKWWQEKGCMLLVQSWFFSQIFF